jgi:hypothetical protein
MKLEHELMAVWKQGFHLFQIKIFPFINKYIHYTYPILEELSFAPVQ